MYKDRGDSIIPQGSCVHEEEDRADASEEDGTRIRRTCVERRDEAEAGEELVEVSTNVDDEFVRGFLRKETAERRGIESGAIEDEEDGESDSEREDGVGERTGENGIRGGKEIVTNSASSRTHGTSGTADRTANAPPTGGHFGERAHGRGSRENGGTRRSELL